jgi:HAD superfamily phosphoserine phosphatase-like hydrolase
MSKLIIVDLDKTLIKGDSIVALSNVLMECELIYQKFWDKISILDSDNHHFSLIKKHELSNIFLSLEKNKQDQILNLLLNRDEIKPIIETILIIDSYRKDGFSILVSSASLDFLVLPILKKLSFNYEYLHCSSFINKSKGLSVFKPNNSGLNKLQSIKDHFVLFGKPEEIIVFSDHFSDLPILLLGNKSFLVKNRKYGFDDWSSFFNLELILHS